MSFTSKILLGLALGIGLGLFVGDVAAPLSIGGEVYIGLLQMTVLPYIVVSLVGNLGRITWSESRGLLRAAIAVAAVMLLLGVVSLGVAPLAFPDWQTASFFSASLTQPPKTFDLVDLYVPANPFGSLANNVVPAVVLFSILLGVGLSGVPGNRGLLNALDVLAQALNRINKLVIRLTPLGVFLIAAGTAGTITLTEMSRLQAYVVTYTALALVLSFVVLPLLVTALTPFRYGDLLSIPRDTLITIFAAAKIIVVLPQLVENVKELFRRYDLADDDVESGADVLMPLAYPFPNIGTYAILMFVPFAAWYLGRSVEGADQLAFHGAALLSSFVAPIIGIPFLLELLQIPSDMMELFVISTVYTDRIRVVLGAIHLLMLTILALAIQRGAFRVDRARLLRATLVSVLAVAAVLIGCRLYLANSLGDAYEADAALIHIDWMDRPVAARVYRDAPPGPEQGDLAGGRLSVVEARGSLRVGFLRDALPFAFTNEGGEVVGFDVEMAHQLANELGVELELVRTSLGEIEEHFEAGQIDIVMSGLALTAARARRWYMGPSPIDLTMSFLVADHRRSDFRSLESLQTTSALRIGAIQSDPGFQAFIRSHVPNAEVVPVDSPREFVRGQRPDLDAVVYSAEGGSAWTLIYPAYSVAIPMPLIVKAPMVYPMPRDDTEWSQFVTHWVELKRKDGTIDSLFAHWILGGGAVSGERRWSVARDVLGWIE